ncbi:hypothetical protein EVG20_g2068 [Dentipellis fragilis]|uniref:Uncharacterized protein n=1 Tax=Dentipellis fragilis TaxID=205917 RepID=A0A4Y9Z914_9AGAM|nr:hypothetical protein EVG20_g2068 [Dentipellis fragilis]
MSPAAAATGPFPHLATAKALLLPLRDILHEKLRLVRAASSGRHDAVDGKRLRKRNLVAAEIRLDDIHPRAGIRVPILLLPHLDEEPLILLHTPHVRLILVVEPLVAQVDTERGLHAELALHGNARHAAVAQVHGEEAVPVRTGVVAEVDGGRGAVDERGVVELDPGGEVDPRLVALSCCHLRAQAGAVFALCLLPKMTKEAGTYTVIVDHACHAAEELEPLASRHLETVLAVAMGMEWYASVVVQGQFGGYYRKAEGSHGVVGWGRSVGGKYEGGTSVRADWFLYALSMDSMWRMLRRRASESVHGNSLAE